jgi:hypothetical protein
MWEMCVSLYQQNDQAHRHQLFLLGLAFELVRVVLRPGDCDDGVYRAIASKLIELNKAGEHNPELLCEQALKAFREPPAVES